MKYASVEWSPKRHFGDSFICYRRSTPATTISALLTSPLTIKSFAVLSSLLGPWYPRICIFMVQYSHYSNWLLCGGADVLTLVGQMGIKAWFNEIRIRDLIWLIFYLTNHRCRRCCPSSSPALSLASNLVLALCFIVKIQNPPSPRFLSIYILQQTRRNCPCLHFRINCSFVLLWLLNNGADGVGGHPPSSLVHYHLSEIVLWAKERK